MTRSRERYYRGLYLAAAAYDIALGIVFTFFYRAAFDVLNIAEPPPGGGYLPLIGSFLFVIGVGYALILRGDLWRNRDLVAVGALYKLAYSTVAFVFWALGDLPHILFAAAFGVVDAVFLVLMVECLVFLVRHAPAAVPGRSAGEEPRAA